jgi:hypothetical protein
MKKNKNRFEEWLKEPFSLFTKRIKNPENPGDFATVIRGTSILHGKFFATDEHGWKIWGTNSFGKRDGLIVTFIPDKDIMFLKTYINGERQKLLTSMRGYNTKGVPYFVTTMNETSDPTEQNGTLHDITAYCETKVDDVELQKILVKHINVTVDGTATPKTIERVYEPKIGGPTFPTVINIYKDIELGKLYTIWMRPEKERGKYTIIAVARSHAEEDSNSELGYKSHFEEIVILSKPNSIGDYPEKDPSAFAELFDVQWYEKLKQEDNCEGLFVTFEKTENGHINHAVMKVTDDNGNEKEIKKDLEEAEVALLLLDLQRGTGSGVAQVRASVLAHNDNAGEGEVPSSGPEDVQRSGGEAPSVPDGSEDRVNGADDNQA